MEGVNVKIGASRQNRCLQMDRNDHRNQTPTPRQNIIAKGFYNAQPDTNNALKSMGVASKLEGKGEHKCVYRVGS